MTALPQMGRRAARASTEPLALLVDDDVELRAFAAASLRAAGWQVIEAGDGLAALAVIDRQTPDLIISDLHMPRVDGRELLGAARARAELAHVPFVLLSGDADTAMRIALLDQGASDVLSKPIDAAELCARARAQLRTTRTVRRLQTQSELDELTGVLNRRGLMRALEREINRCQRSAQPLAVLLVDVDRFKAINDTFGHLTGDHVLAALAQTLAEAVRACDLVGRLGGDEFLVVLPDADETAACEIAERLRRHAGALRVPGTEQVIGISIGAVVESSGAPTIAAFIEAADQAMYRDKTRPLRTLAVG
ncbi:MAG TPA: diguanylate cyclase [Kofleriaceae bacterium]|nr:diguanylate cyclase [Kofleriaceae bacterium]